MLSDTLLTQQNIIVPFWEEGVTIREKKIAPYWK